MYTGRIEIPFEGRTLEDATDFAINLLSCLYKTRRGAGAPLAKRLVGARRVAVRGGCRARCTVSIFDAIVVGCSGRWRRSYRSEPVNPSLRLNSA